MSANETRDDVPRTDAGATSQQAERAPEADGGRDAAATAESAELEALRDRHLRLAAEYDNFRKRTDRERQDSWTRAQAQIVEQLLDPLDDLQRVAHFKEADGAGPVLEGVQLVERKLLRVLESAGLEVIDSAGQAFDPSIHEAIATTPAESDAEDDTVADVFQKGYRFKGVLLRPARVRVKKYEG